MDRILLAHGSGGREMHSLISDLMAPAFGMSELMDSAVLKWGGGGKLAMTTDSYVVSPLFFPGGDIGDLAVNGTVNDLAMVGAEPLYLTSGFVIEEGLPVEDLRRIVSSMAGAAKKAGVRVVAGDTKVVEKGKGDGLFINTSGVGVLREAVDFLPSRITPGDKIILSGPIGSHGIAVIAQRNGLSFDPPVGSDTAALNGLVRTMIEAAGDGGIKAMRDPTRGGVATTLKELAVASGLCLRVDEGAIALPDGVRGACELLGLDPLYIANEGVLLAVVGHDVAEYILTAMRDHPFGKHSSIIGEAAGSPAGTVLLATSVGGTRAVDMLRGHQLPRIC